MAATKSCNVASLEATPVRKLGEGPSVSPSISLDPRASFLSSPSVAEKILSGVIPLADLEKVMRQTFDQTTIIFFHTVGQATDELAKVKGEQGALSDKLEKLAVLVGELRDTLAWSKQSAMEEFKSSSKYEVAIENAASKYFGECFNFCKWQLRHHHPNLAIDLEGMGFDHDILVEEDENGGEKEKEDGEKGKNNPLLPKHL
ncbi:hypothetical protein Acr_00g0047120 [Actinidia rufa]|uniref:Uncharacterized protein n=1 Tax=Actinidia rufa TaxID=165716 RepID=A0A7J0DL63_9ERIC|nr:hypothetical protein Acr_00g0047120 [Actinidia rufa]